MAVRTGAPWRDLTSGFGAWQSGLVKVSGSVVVLFGGYRCGLMRSG